MKYSIKPIQKALIFGYSIVLIGLLNGCSKVNYIEDVPQNFSFDDQEIRQELFGTKPQEVKQPDPEPVVVPPEPPKNPGLTDRQVYLREKYSKMLEVDPIEINNFALYSLIDLWLYVPYAQSGMSKTEGVNTAAFASNYYQSSHNKMIPINAKALYESGLLQMFTDKNYLATGDIIFLREAPMMPVSEVAIYLVNNYVLFSSPDRGLYIYKFRDPYFQERYISAGRVQ